MYLGNMCGDRIHSNIIEIDPLIISFKVFSKNNYWLIWKFVEYVH